MRAHENIAVFSPSGRHTYNPEMEKRGEKKWKGGSTPKSDDEVYGDYKKQKSFNNEYYPTTIIRVSNGDRTRPEVGYHPTQKPVSLMGYLVRTFTNEGETVLDIAMGSGSTGVACIENGRNFIGIEKEEKYFKIAKSRIASARLPLFTER